jgi:hypothetical protein
VETYVTEDWGEHVLQHARVTADDEAALERVRALTEPGIAPVVRHFLSGDAAHVMSAERLAASYAADKTRSSG